MERLELSKAGLKNLSRDRFAFIPVSSGKLQFVVDSVVTDTREFAGHSLDAGEENRTPKTLVLSERCLPVASLPPNEVPKC